MAEIEPNEAKKIFQVEGRKLRNIVNKIEVADIKTIGENLIEGLDDIFFMVQLPEIILMNCAAQGDLGKSLETYLKYKQNQKELTNMLAEIHREFAAKYKDRSKIVATSEGVGWAHLEVARILQFHKQHKESYDNLLYSAVVWMWTLFEVFSGHLWEVTLNRSFDTLGKDALKRMAKTQNDLFAYEDKYRGKYIRIDHLAAFNYNIRENVGSILRYYFDFNSLLGIKNAYKFAFPRSTTIEKSLSDETLRLLEADRNLVVHKAGYIDSKYKNITNIDQKIGDKLSIREEKCGLYHTIIMKVARNMLDVSNRYLSISSEPPE